MQKTRGVLFVIFAAFLFSSVVYLIVGFTLSLSHWKPVLKAGGIQQTIFWLFAALSGALFFAAIQIRAKIADRPIQAGEDPEAARKYFVSRYIMLYAIAEAPAIFGLVYFMLSGDFSLQMLLWVVSAVIFLFARPAVSETR